MRALRQFAALLTFRMVHVAIPHPRSASVDTQAGIGQKVCDDDFVAFQTAKVSPEDQQEQVLTEAG
jgi:hypothetical protein